MELWEGEQPPFWLGLLLLVQIQSSLVTNVRTKENLRAV